MNLRKSAAAGVRWTTVSMIGVTLMETIRLVVLARLLPPDAFGIMAMMLVVIGFGQIFSQMGLVQAVIQRPSPTDDELVSLYWLNIGAGGLVYIALLVATPLVAILYSLLDLQSMLPYVGLMLLCNPLGDLYRAMLEKKLRFKQLAYVELAGAFLGMVLAIALAVIDCGVWSLIWGHLATVACRNIGFFILGQKMFRPRFHFQIDNLQGYLHFALYHVGAMIANYINSRMDQFVIGALLGPQALGYYSMAFNLIMRPVQRVNPVLTRVAFPVLVKVQSDSERMKRGYFKMLNMLTSVNAPILIGFAAVAPVAIPLILGEKWLPIVPVSQVLALYTLIRSTGDAGGSVVLAKGRTDIEFYWNLLLFTIIPLVVFCSAYFGDLLIVAWTLLGIQSVLFFIWYILVVQNLLGPCFAGYIKAIGVPFFSSIVMGGIIFSLNIYTQMDVNLLNLMIFVCTGCFIYLSVYIIIDRDNFNEFFWLLLKKE